MSEEVQSLKEELRVATRQLEDEKKKVSTLEQRLALFEKDATARGFHALNNIVNQQVDILLDFKLKDEISRNPKDEKMYDRVESLWGKIHTMISNLNTLKTELKLTGNEEEDVKKRSSWLEKLAESR